jgi:hypothetical protein
MAPVETTQPQGNVEAAHRQSMTICNALTNIVASPTQSHTGIRNPRPDHARLGLGRSIAADPGGPPTGYPSGR